ncbi:MAG: hypothetical protein HFH13_01725 [Dorea sp.]|nr:hypothetical protein [Dorea sp.]
MQVKSKKTCLNTLSSAPAGLSQTDFLEEVKNDNASSQSGAVEMMNYLKENYKHINFSFISFDNNSQIGQYGSTMKGKNNVAISSELLEKMSTDEEVRNHVENILRHLNSYQNAAQTGAFLKDKELVSMGLVIDEDGKVSMWTATKDRDKEKIYPTYWRDEESTNFYSKYAKKKNSSSNYNFSRSNNMMRLASAKNVPAVRGLIAAKYGEIQTVKAKVKDPVEAAAIVRKIKSVIQSGNIKISRLHKEENLALLKKSAEKKMKEKLARQLAEELRRKKIARKGQERCQTSHLDDVMPKPSFDDERFRQIAEQYAESLSPGAVAGGTGAAVDTVAGGVSEAVSVTVVAAPVAAIVDCMA